MLTPKICEIWKNTKEWNSPPLSVTEPVERGKKQKTLNLSLLQHLRGNPSPGKPKFGCSSRYLINPPTFWRVLVKLMPRHQLLYRHFSQITSRLLSSINYRGFWHISDTMSSSKLPCAGFLGIVLCGTCDAYQNTLWVLKTCFSISWVLQSALASRW